MQRVCNECRDCQRFTIKTHGYAPAKSIASAQPGDHYMIDLMSMPLSLDGHMFCLVLVDVCTGFVICRPLKDKEMTTIARTLWDIGSVIGLARVLQSDNGSEFVNAVINTMTRLCGVTRRYIALYNPRADGKVERSIKTIKATLMKMMRGTTVLWPYYISFVQYAYNNKVRVLTGVEPFVLMFGRKMNEPHDYTATPIRDDNSVEEWIKHQDKLVSLILPAVHERVLAGQSAARVRLDKIRKSVVRGELLTGTLVLIKDPQHLLNPSLRPPYRVVKRTLHGPYLLRDDTGAMYTRQVPLDQLKVIHSAQPVHSEADAEEDEQSYEVDYIIKHEEIDDGMQYLIKWKGYAVSEATWEHETNLNDIATVERYFRLVMAKQSAAAAVAAVNKKKGGRSRRAAAVVAHYDVVLAWRAGST